MDNKKIILAMGGLIVIGAAYFLFFATNYEYGINLIPNYNLTSQNNSIGL